MEKNYILRVLMIARKGEKSGVYRVLVGKPEGKKPLGRPRRRWENNIKMDLEEVECGGMDWFELAQPQRFRTLGACPACNGIAFILSKLISVTFYWSHFFYLFHYNIESN